MNRAMDTSQQHYSNEALRRLRADHAMVTVFFDGGCPLCRREINHYRNLRGADQLIWVDISSDRSTLERYELDYDTAMARFHVLDANGQWQTGVRGFTELWLQLPAYRWLAITLRGLRLETPLDWLYSRFASWRMQRRCDAGRCTPG